jgi:leucine dehydrogenase
VRAPPPPRRARAGAPHRLRACVPVFKHPFARRSAPGRERGIVAAMPTSLAELMDPAGASRCVLWRDPPSGLCAVLVIDDLSLGPAAGGIRTMPYPDLATMIAEASALARAMTRKCALAGLDAGGAKAVVLDHPGLDRPAAFRRLGLLVAELGGVFRTAGDLGTAPADLAAMAETCPYVHADERGLADAVARGLLACLRACARARGRELAGLRVAVQGCGAIGGAVARALAAAGAVLLIADVDPQRARDLAAETGAKVHDPSDILFAPVDVLAPCAVGGVITADLAAATPAWAVCGAANNLLAAPDVAELLRARGILHVPDVVASAGAVIEGIGRAVMGLPDRAPLIDALGVTAGALLAESAATGATTQALAERRAAARIAAARR